MPLMAAWVVPEALQMDDAKLQTIETRVKLRTSRKTKQIIVRED